MKFDVVHSTTTHNNSPTPVTNLLRGEEGNILSLMRNTNFGALGALFLTSRSLSAFLISDVDRPCRCCDLHFCVVRVARSWDEALDVDGVTNSGVDEVGAVDMTAMRLIGSDRVRF